MENHLLAREVAEIKTLSKVDRRNHGKILTSATFFKHKIGTSRAARAFQDL